MVRLITALLHSIKKADHSSIFHNISFKSIVLRTYYAIPARELALVGRLVEAYMLLFDEIIKITCTGRSAKIM